jgi:hypothetical protein
MHSNNANPTQPASSESFWSLLGQLVATKSFSKRSLESILGITLRRSDANRFFEFYESDSFSVREIEIQKAELRLQKGATDVGLVLIDIKQPCIKLAEIENRHGPLSVLPPGGDSTEEMTYYTFAYAWGRLSFGFPQDRSACLARIVLETKALQEAESATTTASPRRI